MGILSNISTRLKLFIGFGIVVALMVGVSATGVISTLNSQDDAKQIGSVLGKSYGRVANTQTALETARNALTDYFSQDNPEKTTAEFLAFIDPQLKKIGDTAAVMNENVIGTMTSSPPYKNAVLAVKKSVGDFVGAYNAKVRPHLLQNDKDAAYKAFMQDVLPVCNGAMDDYRKLFNEQMSVSIELADHASDPTNMYIGVVITIISMILSVVVAVVLSNYICNRLNVLIKNMDFVAKGDFTFELNAEGSDEFARAEKILIAMRDSLNKMILSVFSTTNKSQEELMDLQSVTDNIVDQTGRSESQSMTVAAASDEMVSTTADIAKNCESAAASAESSNKTTEDGVYHVKETINGIKHQVVKTQEDAEHLNALVEQANKVGTIVQTIDDIANQTNLLALNAAIEAARAGEAGKGFAVVADEVRALASRTSTSTQDITKMVAQMQTDANIANESMVKSLDNMNELATKAGTVEELLRNIIDKVSDVNSQITQIATAAEEQTTATSEISTNMQGVTSVTQEVATLAKEAHKGLELLRNDMRSLDNQLSFFKLRK